MRCGRISREGDVLTLDGNSGTVHAGALTVVREVPAGLFDRLTSLRRAG